MQSVLECFAMTAMAFKLITDTAAVQVAVCANVWHAAKDIKM